MKLACSILAVAATAGVAHASPEPWCGGAVHEQFFASRGNFLYNSDADDVADDTALMNVVGASCQANGEDNAKFHAQLAAARARWAKRLHMSDADWADAAVWIRLDPTSRGSREIMPREHASYSEMSPIDQFAQLSHVSWLGAGSYLADALGPKLTEAGRVAYLQNCLRDKYASPGKDTGGPASWALCWGDVESLDLDKLAAELRSDTTHDGADKMTVRIEAWKLAGQLIPKRRAELDRADPVYKKLVEIADTARKSWAASPDLVALVGALEDAHAKQSRSHQVEQCADKSRSALAAQVSALPSTLFAHMPMLPGNGGESAPKRVDRRNRSQHKPADDSGAYDIPSHKLLAALVTTPDGYLAADALALCASDGDATELAEELGRALGDAPSLRGPRGAALAAMLASQLEPDARGEEIEYPKPGTSVKLGAVQNPMSSRGIIKKLTRHGDTIHIEYDGKNVTATLCNSYRETNHITAIQDDGRLQYERVCDGHETVHYNDAPKPIDVPLVDGAALKPGLTIEYAHGVMMAWAKTTDARPVVALGIALKK